MKKSTRSFKHGIAAYPTKFKGFYISPEKLCMQFEATQVKTRPDLEDKTDLKKTAWGTLEMPVDTHGTDIRGISVGIPLHLYPEILNTLLDTFIEHHDRFPEHSLKQWLLQYAKKVQETIDGQSSTNL